VLWSAPVRYVECDAQGVVFHAHYLTWCDEASGALLSRAGVEHADLLARGLDYSVVASTLSWSSSARWGDTVEVEGAPERVGRTSFVVRYEVRVGERLCCTVTTTYVVVDREGRAVRVPDDLRAAYGG
jgi:acyl-CoA thioester hydrolase